MSEPLIWLSFLPGFFSISFLSPVDTSQIEILYSFGNFAEPHGISVSPNGQIYVADTGNNKVKVYSPSGDSLREIGGYGWGQLEFDRPYDVFAGSGLNIYVADYGNHRIQRFDKDLNYISTLYTRDDDNVSKRFGYPAGVSLSRLGDLFILDTENLRVVKVNTFSTIERTFGGIDAGKGRLRAPRQLNATGKDIICILDDDRVVLFDNFGNYIRSIGEGLLRDPLGMATENDTIYVVDGQSVYVFNSDGRLLRMLTPSNENEGKVNGSFKDLAIYGNRLFLLTDHRLHVFSMRKNPLDNH